MKFRNIIFTLLILCVILSSINFISAEDYTNESSSFIDENEVDLSEDAYNIGVCPIIDFLI